jgi:hypothetical protein
MSRNLQMLIVLYLLTAGVSIAAGECSILSAAEVQKLTGTQVHDIPRQSKPGAGGPAQTMPHPTTGCTLASTN